MCYFLQQAEVLRKHTNLRVAHYCGDMNVDYWDRRRWAKELADQDVWVMTPQILLNILRHGFIKVWQDYLESVSMFCGSYNQGMAHNPECAWHMGMAAMFVHTAQIAYTAVVHCSA